MSVDIMLVYWWAIATIVTFAATYTWLIWWQVRGIRGCALATAETCMALIAWCLALITADRTLVPPIVAMIIFRAGVWPIALGFLVLADLYASDHNDHRSLTTRSYLWFKSLSKERRA